MKNKVKIDIGIDQVEVKKIKKIFLGYENFLRRVYTEKEIEYCLRKKNRFQHLAVRFAAKEAVFKALGSGGNRGMEWTDIEVLHNKQGKPFLKLYNKVNEVAKKRGIKDILISLSHCQEYAIAEVLLVSNSNKESKIKESK